MLSPSIEYVPQHEVALGLSSPLVAVDTNSSLLPNYEVRVEGAYWVRVTFDQLAIADLVEEDWHVTVTSHKDGYSQFLNATTMEEWYYQSAFFNGDAVSVVFDSAEHVVPLVKATVGDAPDPTFGAKALCDETDERVPTTSQRTARMFRGSGGCTAWLVDEGRSNNCFLSAGHCSLDEVSGSSVIQFNVPLSTSTGALQHPSPEFQYSVDATSIQSERDGVGKDWMYLGAFANSNTGLTAFEAQGDAHTLDFTPPSLLGSATVTGFGSVRDADGLKTEFSQSLQTHTSSVFSNSGDVARYRPDTTGGNSGGAVEKAPGVAYAIHTHGGCKANGEGSNAGTLLTQANLQNALNNPRGVCAM
jgi:V8-like Glu-specific endopeptidase